MTCDHRDCQLDTPPDYEDDFGEWHNLCGPKEIKVVVTLYAHGDFDENDISRLVSQTTDFDGVLAASWRKLTAVEELEESCRSSRSTTTPARRRRR